MKIRVIGLVIGLNGSRRVFENFFKKNNIYIYVCVCVCEFPK